ncbi:MAG: family oxidoreductase [Armatimonadetes bacterium]|jgi:NAD(P)-dependent dehydrogenase (short-subunit alcohol dehydrogenase family)|nr:family oxidoreductase [Armatimonadota bacterium]
MFDLSGQTAIVTGGSRGLGREMATALAEQGADLVLCSRGEAEVKETAAAIAAATGRRVLGLAADVTCSAEIRSLVDTALETFGRVDILVNNAGAGLRKPLLDLTEEEWSRIVRVCLDGPFLVAREVAPHMLRAGFGRIINISSSLGAIALPERGPYCAAKGGLLQLTKVMALEWASGGVTVNAICPGPFRTPYNLRLEENPALYESYLNLIPQHRWGELSEIRGAAVFLASRESSFITGTALYVDGGWTSHAGIPLAGATDPQ